MVVVPGIVTPAVLWTDVASRLGQSFDTYVLDVRGRGLSESGEHLDYGIDACADDLAAFIEVAGLKNVQVLGHSNGARIAARAARRSPSAIARLVLADPPVSGPGRRPYPSPLGPILALLESARLGKAWEGLKASPYAPWPESLMRLRAEWLHTCDPRAAEVTHRGFHEDDFHGDLASLRLPASLVAAGKGGVITESDLQEIAGLNPSVGILKVENAGHQMQIEDFEGFFAALSQALDTKL